MGGLKNPQNLISGGVGIIEGGWKMTKNIIRKAMVSCLNFTSKYYSQAHRIK